MYRIARQGWTAEAAFEEARTVGMRWWHFPVKGQLEAFTWQHATRLERPRQAPTAQP
jgi:hypothetical protein